MAVENFALAVGRFRQHDHIEAFVAAAQGVHLEFDAFADFGGILGVRGLDDAELHDPGRRGQGESNRGKCGKQQFFHRIDPCLNCCGIISNRALVFKTFVEENGVCDLSVFAGRCVFCG